MPPSVMRLRRTIQPRLFTFIYHRGAFAYDKLTEWLFLGEWSRWQDTVLSYLPPSGDILELGCGTGRLARRGSDAGWRWVALDQSPAMVARARRRARCSLPPIVRADALRLPFAPQSFDAVVATFPAPYIFAPDTVREMARVLRSGGTAVIIISADLAGNDWSHRWRRSLLELFYGSTPSQRLSDNVFPGFSQDVITDETAFGRAHLVLLCLELPSF